MRTTFYEVSLRLLKMPSDSAHSISLSATPCPRSSRSLKGGGMLAIAVSLPFHPRTFTDLLRFLMEPTIQVPASCLRCEHGWVVPVNSDSINTRHSPQIIATEMLAWWLSWTRCVDRMVTVVDCCKRFFRSIRLNRIRSGGVNVLRALHRYHNDLCHTKCIAIAVSLVTWAGSATTLTRHFFVNARLQLSIHATTNQARA